MRTWVEVLSELTEDQLLLIIADHRELREKGAIGDCFLRNVADERCQELGNRSIVVMIMNDLANYAYEHFAEKYFELAEIEI